MSRKMKDSGIEWIGEIPEDWEVIKVKNLAKGKDTLFLDGDWIESNVIVSEGVRYLTTGNIGEGYFKEQGNGYISEETLLNMNCLVVYPGDLVISRLNKPIGRACLLPNTHDKYVIAVDNVVLRPNSKMYDKLFLKFVMNVDGYSEESNIISRGATMPRISRTLLSNIKIPTPPLIQQQKIANFLDQKVSEIDHILEKTRESIEEYKKYKQSLITEAVTKGLNPDVEMKDSGIEWIGEIPKHWEVNKPFRVCKAIRGNCSFQKSDLKDAGKFIALQYGKTYKVDEVNNNFNFYVDESFYKEDQVVNNGDTILVSTSETIEDLGHSCFYVRNDVGLLGGEQMCLKPNKELIMEKFLYYATTYFHIELNQFATGLKVYRFKLDDLKKINIVIPPIDDQTKIVKNLDSKIPLLERIISQKEALLSELETYKKSLIYECVTGKREVD